MFKAVMTRKPIWKPTPLPSRGKPNSFPNLSPSFVPFIHNKHIRSDGPQTIHQS